VNGVRACDGVDGGSSMSDGVTEDYGRDILRAIQQRADT